MKSRDYGKHARWFEVPFYLGIDRPPYGIYDTVLISKVGDMLEACVKNINDELLKDVHAEVRAGGPWEHSDGFSNRAKK